MVTAQAVRFLFVNLLIGASLGFFHVGTIPLEDDVVSDGHVLPRWGTSDPIELHSPTLHFFIHASQPKVQLYLVERPRVSSNSSAVEVNLRISEESPFTPISAATLVVDHFCVPHSIATIDVALRLTTFSPKSAIAAPITNVKFRYRFACHPSTFASIPGIELLSFGYDAVQGRSTNQPIVTFTYSQNKTYIDTNVPGWPCYPIPDQTNVVTSTGAGAQSDILYSSSDYANMLSREADLGFAVGLFSLSTQVQWSESVFGTHSEMVGVTRETAALYEIGMLPPRYLLISDEFNEAIARMPTTYDPTLYGEFVQAFGTHYISGGLFGGSAWMRTTVTNDFYNQSSSLQLSANIGLSFHEAKAGAGAMYSRSSTTQNFRMQSSNDTALFGGDPAQGGSSLCQWQQWVHTIPENPWLVQQRLRPIYLLVNDTAKKANIQQAVNAYIAANKIPPLYVPKTTNFPLSTFNTTENPYGSRYWPGCPPSQFLIGFTSMDDNDPRGPSICSSVQRNPFQGMNLTESVQQETKPSPPSTRPAARRPSRHPTPAPTRHPLLGGLDALAVGFDIVTGNRMTLPLVELTYTSGKTWTNPYNSSLVYSVPDQMNVESAPEFGIQTSIYLSITQWGDSKGHGFGLTIDGTGVPSGLPLSGSIKWNSLKSFFEMSESIVTETTETVSLYQGALEPSFLLSPSTIFAQSVAMLPTAYDAEVYADFVKVFGTHYITQATYGGQAVQYSMVDNQYYSSNTQTSINANVQLQYDNFKLGFGHSGGNQFEEFNNRSFSYVYFIGGDYSSYVLSDWDEWKTTVYAAPAQVASLLTPVTNLISNPTIVANLNKAIAAYYAANTVVKPPVVPVNYDNKFDSVLNYLGLCNATQLTCGFARAYNDYPCFPQACCSPMVAPGTTPSDLLPRLALTQHQVVDGVLCRDFNTVLQDFEDVDNGFNCHYPAAPVTCATLSIVWP